MDREPTEEELEQIIAEQMQCLPAWWPAPGETDPDDEPEFTTAESKARRREQIAALVRQGKSDLEIARLLGISRGVAYFVRRHSLGLGRGRGRG